MNRRRALAMFGTVGLAGAAGCLSDELEYTAEPAAIPDATDQGYEADGPEDIEFDETIGAAGIERDVHIRTWSVSYADPDDESVVFLVSTPDVSIAGISANPLARLSGADLIARVLDEGLGAADVEGGIQDVEAEDETAVTVLGESRTMEVYSAVIEADGAEQATESGEIPIKLYVLSFSHEDDVILSVGFHPDMEELAEEIDEDELPDDVSADELPDDISDEDAEAETEATGDDLISLMEGIDHPVELDVE